MREFKSIIPEGLPDEFEASFYDEEPIVTIEESRRRITASYTFPGFFMVEDNQNIGGKELEFKQINIEGTGFIAENGKPQLPSFGRYIQIPSGCDYKVSVYEKETVEFDKVLVKPAQAEQTDNPDEQHILAYDQKTYASENLFPEEYVRVLGPYQIDGYIALLLHVCPFQYNPAQKKLICYGNIDVTIDLIEKTSEVDDNQFFDSESNLEGFGNLFLNPRRNIERRLDVESNLRPIPPKFERVGPELLIIYHHSFKKAAEKLNLWKTKNGLRSKAISIDNVPNYSAATDDESRVASLKTYIRKSKKFRVMNRRFQIPRLRYVLLFGDVDMIASETISEDQASGGAWGPVNISDYYYSTSKDPENNAEMVFPWLALGRVPVRTSAEGMDVVNQIVKYEKYPPRDPDYYKRATFAALFQDRRGTGRSTRAYMRTLEKIRQRMLSLDFDITRVYVTDCPDSEIQYYSDGSAVPQDVKDAIIDEETATETLISETSEGQLLIAHRDHGMQDGWHLPAFRRHHLSQLTGDTPSIFYSLNCQTGWFDRGANVESFAETMLRIPGGAPSLIAATRNSSTSHNDEMMQALFDASWGGVLPTFPASTTASYTVKNNRLGDILNYGKSYLPIASSNSVFNKDHFEIYHVIGDPSLEVWKAEPRNIKMRARFIPSLRRGGLLSIILSHCPKGSVVTIWLKNKLMKRIEPSSTTMTLSAKDFRDPVRPGSPLRLNPVYICFGAPGYRFRQVRVRIF
ncbi:MAG: hypothetical protein GY702_24285 [Desulfobulbaceae bacterium]|nr:hypothetical protein [Desulfobulbaceae bacterium]